jgi:hypothetical protein
VTSVSLRISIDTGPGPDMALSTSASALEASPDANRVSAECFCECCEVGVGEIGSASAVRTIALPVQTDESL